jgi:DNA replication protein DnaC
VRFTTAATAVHKLIEARDEKRLLCFQNQVASDELLIVDDLGLVPLSKTGAELCSKCSADGTTMVRRW